MDENLNEVKNERLLAAIIDYIFTQIIASIISAAGTIVLTLVLPDLMTELMGDSVNSDSGSIIFTGSFFMISLFGTILSLLIYVIYYSVFPLFTRGATLGKLIMKIRVCSKDDTKAGFIQLLLRNFLAYSLIIQLPVSILFFFINFGLLNLLISVVLGFIQTIIILVALIQVVQAKSETFHDKIAKTKVVKRDYDPEKTAKIIYSEVKDWADVKNVTLDEKTSEEVVNDVKGDDDWDF